jgi:MFS family permease
MLALSGFFALMTTIAANSLIQQHTPYAIRGKILGIYTVIFSGSMAFGAPAVGYFTDFFGPQETLILGGIAVAIVSLIVILLAIRRERV